MKTQIIIQILIAAICIGGSVTGFIKLPKKQNKIMPIIILVIGIVGSILLWTID